MSDGSRLQQGGTHDGMSVGQPAPPLPADPADAQPHRGLRPGPHAVLCNGRHSHLRLIQSGAGSGSGGGCLQGAQLDRFL